MPSTSYVVLARGFSGGKPLASPSISILSPSIIIDQTLGAHCDFMYSTALKLHHNSNKYSDQRNTTLPPSNTQPVPHT